MKSEDLTMIFERTNNLDNELFNSCQDNRIIVSCSDEIFKTKWTQLIYWVYPVCTVGVLGIFFNYYKIGIFAGELGLDDGGMSHDFIHARFAYFIRTSVLLSTHRRENWNDRRMKIYILLQEPQKPVNASYLYQTLTYRKYAYYLFIFFGTSLFASLDTDDVHTRKSSFRLNNSMTFYLI